MTNPATFTVLLFALFSALLVLSASAELQYRTISTFDGFDEPFRMKQEEVGSSNSTVTDDSATGNERSTFLNFIKSAGGGETSVYSIQQNAVYFSSSFGVTASFTLQYDGDNSATLNPSGLGELDLTYRSRAEGFLFRISSDHVAGLNVRVHSANGGFSAFNTTIAATPSDSYDHILVPFHMLQGSADVQRVGSVEVTVIMTSDATDLIMQEILLVTTSTRVALVAPFNGPSSSLLLLSTRVALVAPFNGPCLLPSSSSSSSVSSSSSISSNSTSSPSSSPSTTDEEHTRSAHLSLVESLSRFLSTKTSQQVRASSTTFAKITASKGNDGATTDHNNVSNNVLIIAESSSASSLSSTILLVSLSFVISLLLL
eukprot:CAMPEP_0184370594 /NCGR_PEP_ID=MMETSP1089-20130417/162920_1 /TAXON_ID=38269 ORGANISM="Gloeochaete wittrockiana, Strain SAG46.84" /NCGR_SAMPLE_ID=MMETSP1089 /ASSEMBLY_ACC=CAM_ASM_000445 /LENGTH=371 /DNA_ID=CAMNT_0026713235 /DNA_START=85 /DNA_END=1201 /DNA_ORIENTATION=+